MNYRVIFVALVSSLLSSAFPVFFTSAAVGRRGNDTVAVDAPKVGSNNLPKFKDPNSPANPVTKALQGYNAAISLARDGQNAFEWTLSSFKVSKRSKTVKRIAGVAVLFAIVFFVSLMAWLTFGLGRFIIMKGENPVQQKVIGYAFIAIGSIVGLTAVSGFLYLLFRIFK